MDTNWFYSTISQCAAAIVGLVGGFIGSRIVEQTGRALELRAEAIKDLCQIKNGTNDFVMTVRGYATYLQDEIEKNKVRLQQGHQNRKVSSGRTLGGAWSGGITIIEISEDLRASQLFIIPFLNAIEELLKGKQFPGIFSRKVQIINRLLAIEEEMMIESKKKSISEKFEDVKILSSMLLNYAKQLDECCARYLVYQGKIIPMHFYVGLAILCFIAITSIIFPLTYLSAIEDGSKIWFMGLFGSGLFLLFCFLGYQLYYLRKISKIDLV
jgi:hypothetical protein